MYVHVCMYPHNTYTRTTHTHTLSMIRKKRSKHIITHSYIHAMEEEIQKHIHMHNTHTHSML